MNRSLIWAIKRELTTPIKQFELEREGKRSILLLGLLAVFVTARISAKPTDQFTVLNVQYNLVPVLNILISAWVAYAGLMLVFISDDIFSSRRWIVVRRLAGLTGVIIGLEVPAILLWVMISTPSILLLPLWLLPWLIVLPLILPIIWLYAYVLSGPIRIARKTIGKLLDR